LKTRDLKVAQAHRWERVAHFHEVFGRLRGDATLTSDDIEAIADHAYDKFLVDAAEASAKRHPKANAGTTYGRPEADPEREELQIHQWAIEDDIERGDYNWIHDEIASALTKVGVDVDPTSPVYQETGQALLSAMHSAASARKAVLKQETFQKPEVFNAKLIDPKTAKVRKRRKRPKAGDPDTPRFLELTELYIAEVTRDPGHRITDQTIKQSRSAYRLFNQYFDDPPIQSITRQDASKFLDDIATLQPSWSRSPASQGLSVHELLEQHRDPTGGGLKNKTINRYVSALSQAWKWARNRGYVEGENPFAEQSRRVGGSKAGGRQQWTIDELNTLFGSPLFRDTAVTQRLKPNRHTIDTVHLWAPLISLFSGMRLDEICKLTAKAVRETEGVWFFDVQDDEAGRVKTDSSARRVPVHSELQRCGFLDYLAATSGHPSGQLFPALKPGGPNGKLSWYYSKRFTVLRRRCGIDRPSVVFHSFRNTVATALENARVPGNEVAEILGHAKAGMSFGVYSQGLGLQELQEVVERIRYPGLRFEHLYVD
jgi:integrase